MVESRKFLDLPFSVVSSSHRRHLCGALLRRAVPQSHPHIIDYPIPPLTLTRLMPDWRSSPTRISNARHVTGPVSRHDLGARLPDGQLGHLQMLVSLEWSLDFPIFCDWLARRPDSSLKLKDVELSLYLKPRGRCCESFGLDFHLSAMTTSQTSFGTTATASAFRLSPQLCHCLVGFCLRPASSVQSGVASSESYIALP